jgi:hypothetical protein
MSMRYKIYQDRNLLVDILDGPIGLTDLEKVFRHEIGDERFKWVNKVLSNINDAQLNISLAELQTFISLMSTPNPDTSFRWAILTDKPDQTAFSFLVKEDKYFSDIVGVYSTLEACNRFLNVSYDATEFLDEDYTILI